MPNKAPAPSYLVQLQYQVVDLLFVPTSPPEVQESTTVQGVLLARMFVSTYLVPGTQFFPWLLTVQCRDNKKMSYHLTVLQIVPFEMSHF